MTIVVLPVVLFTMRKTVEKKTWLSVALALAGIVIALGSSFSDINLNGILFMLLGCIIRAVFIVKLNDYAKDCKEGKYNGFYEEGCDTLQACFDKNYLFFLRLNKTVNRNISSLLGEIADGSREWVVLNKILNCAIGTTAFYILHGNDVEFKFIKGCKNIPDRIKYGKSKSNFR